MFTVFSNAVRHPESSAQRMLSLLLRTGVPYVLTEAALHPHCLLMILDLNFHAQTQITFSG